MAEEVSASSSAAVGKMTMVVGTSTISVFNVCLLCLGAADVVSFVEADLKRSSMRVIKKAKDLCMQVSDATFEVVEGDARNVLCEAVEKHRAELLVVGSHGYGAIKRYTPPIQFTTPARSSAPLFFPVLKAGSHHD
ncbi:hypothetical protein QOZ80_5BG0441590 [Eleusine coracana subsp. coracana]|nr:hypothetical protein QOZ80_5BG0441590 [Eleusine coracana subsp. coracana]